MRRLLPNTLMSQMILILLAGLVVSHLVAGWIHASDRVRAVRAIGGYAAAQRIANLARVIEEAPVDLRTRIIAAVADPRLRIMLASQPPPIMAESVEASDLPIRDYLLDLLPDQLADTLQIAVARPAGGGAGVGTGGGAGQQAQPRQARAHRMHGQEPHHGPPAGPALWRRLRATVQLSDGSFLTVTLGLPDAGPSPTLPFLTALGVMAGILVLASLWAVRRVTAPLGVVTRAAERLGRDVDAPPIAETGSQEMRQAAHAFNEMQARLRRLLRNRTTMLAALSHDLRTPLTLLRLRIEGLRDPEERDRMLASIATLEGMVDATLKFARDTTAPEAWRRTDLTALLGSIVDDMEDAGMPASLGPADPVVLECQPGGLRRAVTNLVENAVKYGGCARVGLTATPDTVSITVDDDGPGMPEEELLKVFEPFYRLEQSRSRETGGTGLGLAIAQAIAVAHHGTITLANRPQGGLRARLDLPRPAR